MNSNTESGRLPLVGPDSLTPEQRPVYEKLVAQIGPWAKSLGFEGVSADGLLQGPFNGLLYTPKITPSNLEYFDAEHRQTSLSPQVREAVIVTVALHFDAKYEEYIHSRIAQQMGVSPGGIRAAMSDGSSPVVAQTPGASDLLAAQIVSGILKEHRISNELYQTAVDVFGQQGVVEIAHLVGMYAMVSFLLNVFEIPAPSSGAG